MSDLNGAVPLAARNGRTLGVLLTVVGAMVGLSFAAVPLYDLFCRVTGWGGTTQRSEAAPTVILDRTVHVDFVANLGPNLPWSFRPGQGRTQVRLGEVAQIPYQVKNLAPEVTAGVAVYHVSPERAGRYFHKIACFCFAEQALSPGERMEWPVIFYVDPAMADDPELDTVGTITLSYTFYPADSAALQTATNSFIERQGAPTPRATN